MASVISSSCRSSSSYRSSSHYSTSNSYCSEGSFGGSSDSLDTLFDPFLDSAECNSLFGDEGPRSSTCMTPFSLQRRSSYRQTGSAVTSRQPGPGGRVQLVGDSYCTSADISQFEPHDIVVMAYNHHIVVHAQKVMDDGSVSKIFTHKSQFPEDMDPLSVRGTLNPDGTLVVTVHQTIESGPDPLPTYQSEARL
ncbi:unnamed protein product [Ophioblennius macclurei]